MIKLLTYVPPFVIVWLGKLQFRVPILGAGIRFIGRSATRGICIIQHGVGKGLRIDNTLGLPGYAMGTTEPEEQAAIEKLISLGDVVWNVGANIGFHAILAGREVGQSGLVVAFEPVKRLAVTIQKNAKLNDMENVQVVNVLVSDKVATIDFFERTHSGANSIFQNLGVQETHSRIPSTTLDEYATNAVRPPTLIMIDVEGAELLVLQGGVKTISQFKPTILIENHWLQREILNFYDTFLHPLGYRCYEIDFKPYRTKESPMREHIIMIPTGQASMLGV